ncbi:DUF427 domain-containing protein [Tumidithrix elongata RA019]|uniref:DUF427 domain-containing protein n=1 Tax=Tumidithrix elongata BACA0141 TaxID=2716417 RepID=A0AAW9PRF4_9CYAN|nr:DUF427 domain-containing protein [Tumidithrix elongata RA019]
MSLFNRPQPIAPQTGQESVWDYPRPPHLEPTSKHIQIIFNQVTIADTCHAKRVLETSHPPVYYIPPQDIQMEYLTPEPQSSFCEWKGVAGYYTVTVGNRIAKNVAWYYPDPTLSFLSIKDHVAFYAGSMDVCYVDGEIVQPQPGGFYGGWITPDIVGPFKGEQGSFGW